MNYGILYSEVQFLVPLLSGIFTVSVGFFVLLQKHKSRQNFFYAMGVFSLAVWFFSGVWRDFLVAHSIIPDIEARLLMLSTTFAVVFGVHFAWLFIRPLKIHLFWYYFIYILGILLSIAAFSIHSVKATYIANGKLVREFGPLYYIYAAHCFLSGFYMVGIIIYKIRTTNSALRKRQGFYFLLGFSSTLVGGSFAVLAPLFFGVQFLLLAQIGFAGFFVFTTYGIIRYKAMDIDQILTKTTIWILMVMLMLAPAFAFTILLLENGSNVAPIFMLGAILAGSAINYVSIRYLKPQLELNISRKSSLFVELQQKFNDKIMHLRALPELNLYMASLLQRAMAPTSLKILVRQADSNEFLLMLMPIPESAQGETLEQADLDYLSSTQEIIEKEQILYNPEYKNNQKIATSLFRRFQCELMIPISFQENLLAVILVGPKLYGSFSRLEINFLEKIYSGVTVAYSNSLLLTRIENIKQELEKKVIARTRELQESFATLNELYGEVKSHLRLAKQFQDNILPPMDANLNGFNLIVKYEPLMEIGGDFYDFFLLEKHRVRLFLADAVGHGVAASLITMLLKNEYDKLKYTVSDPGAVLNQLNDTFTKTYGKLNIFLTGILIDIDSKKRKILYASAGHPEQYLIRHRKLVKLEKTGRAIGFKQGISCASKEIAYQNGDKFILFTDGLFEAFNKDHQIFGMDNIFSLVSESSHKDISSLVGDIIQGLSKHLVSYPKSDDITIVALE